MSDTDARLFPEPPADFHGDTRELLLSIGAAEALPGTGCLTRSSSNVRPKDADSLRVFLRQYVDEILVPIELRAVMNAWQFTESGHARELIELDCALLKEDRLENFREASCAVGRRQLSRLRPLREQRVIQRYWNAMDQGQAAAWHTLVFGMMTSVYSIPLRQGIAQLASQTLGGFTLSAASDYKLRLNDCREVLSEQVERLPLAINGLLDEAFANSDPRVLANGSLAVV